MHEGSSDPASPRRPAGDPRKLGDEAATWEAPQLNGPLSPRAGGKAVASERRLARNLASGGQGSAGLSQAGLRGGGEPGIIRKFPGNSFPFPHSPPFSLGADLSEPWERENEIFFEFPLVPSPDPRHLGLERAWERINTRAPEFQAFPQAGSVSNSLRLLGAPDHAAVRPPSSGRLPPTSVGFSLSWCHMSHGGVGTPGVGGGVCTRRGPPSPPICAAARLTDARNSQ